MCIRDSQYASKKTTRDWNQYALVDFYCTPYIFSLDPMLSSKFTALSPVAHIGQHRQTTAKR